ncbi:MAG: phosphatidylglycerophosphatase A, partial [bacterium]
MKFFIRLIGTGLGSGFSPVASGTAGSLIAALIWWFFLSSLNSYQQIAVILLAFLIGIPICTQLESEYGHDPSQAVFDEFVGQWTALLFLPKTLPALAAAFLIFRVMDVWKPFPAHISQKLPGGLGIMIDDLIAGVYTCLLVHLLRIL